MARMARQIGLFAEPASDLSAVHDDARALAAQLPASLHFGTSSWSFPGWRGLVYAHARSASQLARDGLREYASHPLLTTVGIDRSYYAPIPVEDFRRYASQLPSGFRCAIKAPASVTAWATSGAGSPVRNPDFLSPARLIDELLEPCAVAFADHTGPIILECPPVPRGLTLAPDAFAEQLDACLDQLPRDFAYAVELRDRALLTPTYAAVLARHRATHTYNYWTAMPLPGAQTLTVPVTTGTSETMVIRLLLRPGTRYAAQKAAFEPFDAIVEPDATMRADVLALARRGLAAGRRVYVLVNNKAEGSSPRTIRALAEAWCATEHG